MCPSFTIFSVLVACDHGCSLFLVTVHVVYYQFCGWDHVFSWATNKVMLKEPPKRQHGVIGLQHPVRVPGRNAPKKTL